MAPLDSIGVRLSADVPWLCRTNGGHQLHLSHRPCTLHARRADVPCSGRPWGARPRWQNARPP
eukprot:scaffold587_cov339-Prasinococcus_capsulatus_cf.AAC.1